MTLRVSQHPHTPSISYTGFCCPLSGSSWAPLSLCSCPRGQPSPFNSCLPFKANLVFTSCIKSSLIPQLEVTSPSSKLS